MSIKGRQALVVGGSTGIGKAIAEAWSSAGLEVTVLSRNPPSNQAKIRWMSVDLMDHQAVQAALAEAATGPLQAVCYAAVYYGDRRSLFSETALTEWRQQLEVNLNGLWLTLQATLPSLRQSLPGLFLNVSSEVVYNGGPGRSGYAATKAACASLIDSLSQEEDPAKVRFISALPAGMVDSAGIRRRRPSDFDYSGYMRPESFDRIAVELITNQNQFINGASLMVQANGHWQPVQETKPASQSDRSRL
ncbi:SDR family oxidoreductase [Pantoea brenneri]|uniref:SDR family NAD(P)-dependent oxidoreductase n=1 Tax=Pantoea brenneri TaxID=472694 RepID=UPI00289B460E|nr:SDR family oxidoreductase [Pantoea brenneri]